MGQARHSRAKEGVRRRSLLPMDVPRVVFPSEDELSKCGAINQDWEGVEKEAMDRNLVSNSHF